MYTINVTELLLKSNIH